jgi:hypothetical protein
MMMTDPITLPPELIGRWEEDWHHSKVKHIELEDHIANEAAQWGADQELEACCRWLPKLPPWSANDLRKHRRPKPPSLKEQALAQLDLITQRAYARNFAGFQADTIRRALEALDD